MNSQTTDWSLIVMTVTLLTAVTALLTFLA